MTKERVRELLAAAVARCRQDGSIAVEAEVTIDVVPPKQAAHGDLATNLPLVLAAQTGKKPRDVAKLLVAHLPAADDFLAQVDIAGPGFLNFTIRREWYIEQLSTILTTGDSFGSTNLGFGKKVLIEFVSANPTGPLNVVSARAAAVGDTLANLLEVVGYDVKREYYVNDVGRQTDLFAESLEARYQEANGKKVELPAEGYHGSYLITLAKSLAAQGKKRYALLELRELGLCAMIAGHKKSLEDFGVRFDRWFRQSELMARPVFADTLQRLEKAGYLYEQDGALFFRSTAFADDKDRVVKKQDGSYSYFASDMAYHHDKFQRGFDWAIDLLGPDHHGYVARTKAALQALGFPPEKLTVLILQQVNLLQEHVIVKMSKRAGNIVTMDDLMSEVGSDVARFFFLLRSASAHLDFDLALAQKQSAENPVYYIQYAHARIASIFRKATAAGKMARATPDPTLLTLPEEISLARLLLDFPDCIAEAALELEPHRLAFYLLDLARAVQAYYSKGRADSRYLVLGSDAALTVAKLSLLKCTQIVLQRGLRLLGISAPEEMAREDRSDDA